MPDSLRRRLLYGVMAGLAAVITVGLLTGPVAPTDRAEAIASRLRCPVCQGLSVADSPSDTAQAMHDRIEQLIADGATDEQVEQHFVDRYGEWVLLEPRPGPRTWALWALPVVALAAGGVLLWRLRPHSTPAAPTPEQRAIVARLREPTDGRDEPQP